MNILIAGGTGFIGRSLQNVLRQNGHEVRVLSRKKFTDYFYWNPNKKEIEKEAFENLDAIINLAGESVAQRWTQSNKKKIYSSRVNATKFLYESAKQYATNLKIYISASGINYYGTITQNKAFEESDNNAKDFLGNLCFDWEQAALEFNQLNCRVVCVRTGIVLSKNGGALQKILPMAKLGLNAPLGKANHFMPWIHLKDLTRIYLEAIENDLMIGSYNAVAPEIVNNKEFTFKVNRYLGRTSPLPNVPKFMLKLLYGEMANILTEGSPISVNKIINLGFKFEFTSLEQALTQNQH